ncbi:MAG TPA: LysM peptidoglycan-binding domain-containing protein [Acidimicrobiales bacterium]|nr:LysM peptidoglycan-binding domain-containing protein [Acidimicrobiales bacterium]
MAPSIGGGGRQKLTDVLGSALTALLVFGAIPTVLVIIVGDPLSGGLGSHWSHPARDTLCALTVVAWVSWVACCAPLLRAVVQHVRRGDAGVPLGAPLTDRIAARIAVGILSVTTMGTPLVLASGAGAAMAVRSHVAAPAPAPLNAAPGSYAVQPGDSLWSIADAQLGDGGDWVAIAALNLGRTMADGGRVVDPDLIRAGWALHMPVGPLPDTGVARSSDPGGTRRGRPSTLPELLMLGIGSIGCAALARRSRRARLLRQFDGHRGDDLWVPSAGAVDTDVLLSHFAGVPALASFEAANCLLGRALGTEGRAPGEPRVRTVCVGPAGVTFWLATPGAPPPQGFTLAEGGAAWHVGHEALSGQDPFCPHLPIVLPVGDDAQGTWLVPLQPGGVLPLLGEAAHALWRAARAVQEAWTWADMVVVTEDADEAGQRFREAAGERGSPILFFGDPASLPAALVDGIAVATTATVAASDVTVLVDRQGASIHPLGRTLRPHLLSGGNARLIDELMHPPVAESSPAPLPMPPGGTGGALHHEPFGLHPGTVEVKLLTVTPRIDGLREELAPNRARRAVELVAYLALHRPDTVTSDRLRTRVLGSSDADAASKTLFNTATAARRAMGCDIDGHPLFPAGTRNGQYRVSDEVTVDVQRAAALAAFGNACEDPKLAMAHLRGALALVEGEPLANALSGYSWWEVEGHGGRIAAVLVDAACNLAALAVEARLFALARDGLNRARLVDPYSESLTRAAMQVAAAEGDADRLRREWRECQRRVDEVDPGSSPSLRTERLYGELSRQVPVGALDRGDS